MNVNKRDCIHEECPYKYCQHNKYWNGTEQDRLTSLEKITVAITDKEVEYCMSYMDI